MASLTDLLDFHCVYPPVRTVRCAMENAEDVIRCVTEIRYHDLDTKIFDTENFGAKFGTA